jgi:UDP-N-acetyl-D-mannosaminuronic acid transferase (WecB/TagA/CpsF family)
MVNEWDFEVGKIQDEFKKIKYLTFLAFSGSQCFAVYENKVLQLMLGRASLERFDGKDLVFIKRRLCRHCLKNECTL